MESIAIIGTGIAGMGCGHFLHKHFDLTFYEQNNYVGGHTNTVLVDDGGNKLPVDTGFIVFNNVTYPNLVKLFNRIHVDVKPTNMSFSVHDASTGLEYGSQCLFAQTKNIFSPSYIKLLFQIDRFYREAEEVLTNEKYFSFSLHDYVREKKYNDDFLYRYLVPMSSALWSTPTNLTLQYPAIALVQFFKNHGMLGINTQFQWYTVCNGSWQYRDKLIAPFKHTIQIGNAAKHVTRTNGKVKIVASDGSEKSFDKVIFACHADQALKLVGDGTEHEYILLSQFQYQQNTATLHSDASVMPSIRKIWSAWNYRVDVVDGELKPSTIYDMNILQQVSKTKNYFVSINDPGRIDPSKIIRTIHYEHPIFTPRTAMAQKDLHSLNENGISYFCGSYFRFGFHEDAFTAAVQVCTKILGRDAWNEGRVVKNPKGVVFA